MTIALAGSILTGAQAYLHDDGTLWTRAELLDSLNDGYLRLLAQTHGVRALAALEVPPRYGYAVTQAWEAQHVGASTFEEWAHDARTAAAYRTAYAWEIEHLLGATPAASAHTYTHSWERIESGNPSRIDRYHYPVDHLATRRLTYDEKRLSGTSYRELDAHTDTWETESGEPLWYQRGLGRQGQFEVYEPVTVYAQSYAARDGYGTPRTFSGDRTWAVAALGNVPWDYASTAPGEASHSQTVVRGLGKRVTTDTSASADYQALYDWEVQHVEGATVTDGSTTYVKTAAWEYQHTGDAATVISGLGVPHSFTSAARQYVPVGDLPPYGTPRLWAGSDDALLLDYAVRPPALTETDRPALLPAAFGKYLRFYILARAFGREGEGRNPTLADHFDQRFQMGVRLLRRLAQPAAAARTHQHEAFLPPSRRPGRPRLPSAYPRVF